MSASDEDYVPSPPSSEDEEEEEEIGLGVGLHDEDYMSGATTGWHCIALHCIE
jgi:hypothetical protein